MNPFSEFDLVALLRRRCRSAPKHLGTSIGDDCAVFSPDFAHRMVCTTDLLVEGVHFRRHWISPRFLGRKACLVNLSDLAAMGARPYACLLSLALQRDWLGKGVEQFIDGFVSEAEAQGMPLVGGDLSRSDQLFISVTALGYVEKGEPLLRSTARPGDRIFVIGDLGYSLRGLALLEEASTLDLSGVEDEDELRRLSGSEDAFRCLKAHLHPDIHLQEAIWLQEHGAARAMIDVSDGLASDLQHILEESGVGGEIDVDALPLLEGVDSRETSLSLQLDGGEDYALLFTADAEMEQLMEKGYPVEWSTPRPIGRIVEGPCRISLVSDGRLRTHDPRGFDHFK